MLAVGTLGAYHGLSTSQPVRQGFIGDEAAAAVETPESAAEAFLDAWRRRDFERANLLSRGRAREAVARRAAASEDGGRQDVELEGLWQQLARKGLRFVVYESDNLSDGGVLLHGVAEGELLDQPYRRRVSFTLQPEDGGWYVEHMELGEILTPLPAAAAEGSPRDPGTPAPPAVDSPAPASQP